LAAYVVSPRWPTELIIKQVVGLQFCKPTCAGASSVPLNAGYSDLGIVV
jgi:hypothetical protein